MNKIIPWLIAIIAIPIIIVCLYLIIIWGRYLLQEINHEFRKVKLSIEKFLFYHGW